MKKILQILCFCFFSCAVFGQANNSYTASSTEECVETGSRIVIRALMTSSQLSTDCQYVVTGYSRGCLQATEIVLTATSTNAFSLDVEILTAFDTDYWTGRYDINTNRITALYDNLGNEISGRYGNEVDRFPWGRANVRSNIIHSADVYFDCATTQNINSNSWTDSAFTDLRGFQGVFEQNTVDAYGRIYMNGATQIDFRRNKVQSFAYLYFNSTSNILFRQNCFNSSAYVRKFTGATGRWTMYDSDVSDGDTRHYEGTAYNDDNNLNSRGRLYMRELGTSDIRNTDISNLSYVNLQARSGTTRIWRANIRSLSYFYIRPSVTGGNRYYYSHDQSASTYDYRSGNANITMSNNAQSSAGYILLNNISGTYRIYNNNIDSRAEYRLNGTSGTHTHYHNNISVYAGRINLRNCTGSNIQRNTLAEGRIDAIGGNPKLYYNNFSSIGIATLNNYVGTIQRTVLQSDARLTLSNAGNIYACTFGTSFDFRSSNLSHSYVTAFGNRTHTAGASNNNRGYFHNLVNNLL